MQPIRNSFLGPEWSGQHDYPWWTPAPHTSPEHPKQWQRRDGASATIAFVDNAAVVIGVSRRFPAWIREAGTLGEWGGALHEMMRRIDENVPLRRPTPECGQVWIRLDTGAQEMITALPAFGDVPAMLVLGLPQGDERVGLLSGPGAPWAPCRSAAP